MKLINRIRWSFNHGKLRHYHYRRLFSFIFIFIILISSQICNAQVVVTKNLTAGVNLLKDDGSNVNINFSLTLPPGTSSVTIELENSDTVNNINPYTISFSTQTWAFPLLVGNPYNCTQNYGATLTSTANTIYSAQTLNAQGQAFYSCPSSPTNKLGVKYTSTSALGNLAVYAIVNTNGINLTTPPISITGAAAIAANVQGVTATGTSLASVNPLFVGGHAQSGANGAWYSVSQSGDSLNTTYNSMPVGGISISATGMGTANNTRFPSGNVDGPLAVMVAEPQAGGSQMTNASISNGTSNIATQNAPGLETTNTGYENVNSSTVTGLTIVPLFTPPGTGIYHACYISMQVTFNSGAGSTLDIYFQTGISTTSGVFTDRLHFAQIGAVSGNFFGGISEGVGITPTVMTDATLGGAAAAKVDGPVGSVGRFKFVVGGATPNYTIAWGIACS